MTVLAEVVGLLRLQVDRASFSQANAAVQGLAKGVQAALGADIVARLAGGVRDFAASVDDLGDQAELLGLSARDLQAYTFASEQAGVSAQQFGNALQKLTGNAANAAAGSAETAKLFQRLGVNVRDSEGNVKSLGELLPEVADGLQRVENPTARAGLTMQLFGRQAGRLRPLLEQGSAGLAELRDQFDQLGGGISEDAIKKADQFEKDMARVRVTLRGFGSDLLSQTLPGLSRMGDLLTSAGRPISSLLEGTSVLGGALATTAALGVAAAASMALAEGRAVKLGKAGLLIGGLALAMDELRAYTQGANSAIGQMLSLIGGQNKADEVLRNFTAGVQSLSDAMHGKDSGVTVGDVARETTRKPRLDASISAARASLDQARSRAASFGKDVSFEGIPALEKRLAALESQRAVLEGVQRAEARGVGAGTVAVPFGRAAADTVQQFNTTVNVNKTNADEATIRQAVKKGISDAANEARHNTRRKQPVSP